MNPDYNLVEMKEADRCCGSAASTLSHYDLSRKIGQRKRDNIVASGAEVVATGCPRLYDAALRHARPQRRRHHSQAHDRNLCRLVEIRGALRRQGWLPPPLTPCPGGMIPPGPPSKAKRNGSPCSLRRMGTVSFRLGNSKCRVLEERTNEKTPESCHTRRPRHVATGKRPDS